MANDASAVASLEWWEARLGKYLASPASVAAPLGRLPDLLALLVRATSRDAPIDARGAALDAARRLAIHLGDTGAARRCRGLQAALAARLVQGCAPSMRANVQRVAWIDSVSGVPDAPALHLDQIVDVVSLVRSLTTRDQLRPLLEQILDALILWTRVERGVLLLRAPNGRLVPRVARNLRRVDLHGEQLKLSTSLALKAVEERRTVVAVDAAGESIDARASVHLLQLRSVLAVPLIAGGEVLGVAYLDDRSRRGAFGPQEIAWVDLVAGIAALAIADTRDQLLLRRAVRRAERASEQLTRTLEERTVERDSLAAVVQPGITSAGRARFAEIIGTSSTLSDTLRLAERVARADVPVLILGESGSGKELFARAIHRNGARGTRPFVSENCGAVTETLLESTLFGHVKGAFTGASDRRVGLFELAHRGTLFLDEIGEMSLAMQTKLLRILVDGDVRAVGASVSKHVDVRVIAATHRDLKKMVREGSFREDLYYRLCVVELRVPPLRERIDDIPLLVKHLLNLHAADRRVRVSPQAMNLLVAYSWPGNIRQLENEIRRALILADDLIEPAHLSNDLVASERGGSRSVDSESLVLRERVDELERELIGTALRRTRGNQSKASTLLGVSRFGLQKMMKRLEIELETVAVHPASRSSEP
jgi:transcriptional regulator with GAF, ATPase, and Fis domain